MIGILGGMGPAATAAFFTRLTELTPASRDQDHPRVVVLSDPSVPDRTEQIQSGKDDVTEHLRTNIEALAQWGADFVGVPCNTAHYFLLPIRDELPIPLVSIIDAEVEAALKVVDSANPRAWLTCTRGTLATRLYQDAAEEAGLDLVVPEDSFFDRVSEMIAKVKAGDMAAAGELADNAYPELFAKEDIPVLTACTELPLAFEASGLNRDRQVSSIDALAQKMLRLAGYEPLDA